MSNKGKRGSYEIEVRTVEIDGEQRVLLQLPQAFVALWPSDARLVAGMLVDTSDEIDPPEPISVREVEY